MSYQLDGFMAHAERKRLDAAWCLATWWATWDPARVLESPRSWKPSNYSAQVRVHMKQKAPYRLLLLPDILPSIGWTTNHSQGKVWKSIYGLRGNLLSICHERNWTTRKATHWPIFLITRPGMIYCAQSLTADSAIPWKQLVRSGFFVWFLVLDLSLLNNRIRRYHMQGFKLMSLNWSGMRSWWKIQLQKQGLGITEHENFAPSNHKKHYDSSGNGPCGMRKFMGTHSQICWNAANIIYRISPDVWLLGLRGAIVCIIGPTEAEQDNPSGTCLAESHLKNPGRSLIKKDLQPDEVKSKIGDLVVTRQIDNSNLDPTQDRLVWSFPYFWFQDTIKLSLIHLPEKRQCVPWVPCSGSNFR